MEPRFEYRLFYPLSQAISTYGLHKIGTADRARLVKESLQHLDSCGLLMDGLMDTGSSVVAELRRALRDDEPGACPQSDRVIDVTTFASVGAISEAMNPETLQFVRDTCAASVVVYLHIRGPLGQSSQLFKSELAGLVRMSRKIHRFQVSNPTSWMQFQGLDRAWELDVKGPNDFARWQLEFKRLHRAAGVAWSHRRAASFYWDAMAPCLGSK